MCMYSKLLQASFELRAARRRNQAGSYSTILKISLWKPTEFTPEKNELKLKKHF